MTAGHVESCYNCESKMEAGIGWLPTGQKEKSGFGCPASSLEGQHSSSGRS
jgi:hypothetical protein